MPGGIRWCAIFNGTLTAPLAPWRTVDFPKRQKGPAGESLPDLFALSELLADLDGLARELSQVVENGYLVDFQRLGTTLRFSGEGIAFG